MTKIRLTRNTVVDGRVCEIGEVVETSPATATFLIAIEKAEPAPDVSVETAPEPEPEPKEPEVESAELPMPKAERAVGRAQKKRGNK